MRQRMVVRPTLYKWLVRQAGYSGVGPTINQILREQIDMAAIPPCRRHVAQGMRFSYELHEEVYDLLMAWARANEMNATDITRGCLHRVWESGG